MKLHLGCGKVILKDYLNIDITNSEMNHDIRNFKDVYDDSTIDEIYICHALEHFGKMEIIDILKEYKRILKHNGILRIAVPDLEAIFELYSEDRTNIHKLMGLLYGGQKNEYDFHKYGFTFDSLKSLLESLGYTDVCKYDTWTFLGDTDDYSKAYIPHMDRNGKLMSLNILCTKNVYSNV
jgi:predicted SAM-dependent methyltransferase